MEKCQRCGIDVDGIKMNYLGDTVRRYHHENDCSEIQRLTAENLDLRGKVGRVLDFEYNCGNSDYAVGCDDILKKCQSILKGGDDD